ncbi:hypothetical protein BGW80DRAFT_604027 [Lactifluus volemus]|nr:hypothetical protein BGW80DRAFT_604027 [Lactifluus volemus]
MSTAGPRSVEDPNGKHRLQNLQSQTRRPAHNRAPSCLCGVSLVSKSVFFRPAFPHFWGTRSSLVKAR